MDIIEDFANGVTKLKKPTEFLPVILEPGSSNNYIGQTNISAQTPNQVDIYLLEPQISSGTIQARVKFVQVPDSKSFVFGLLVQFIDSQNYVMVGCKNNAFIIYQVKNGTPQVLAEKQATHSPKLNRWIGFKITLASTISLQFDNHDVLSANMVVQSGKIGIISSNIVAQIDDLIAKTQTSPSLPSITSYTKEVAIGAQMTISGQNLESAFQVYFGSIAVIPEIITPTKVAAIVPQNASDGALSLKFTDGTVVQAGPFAIQKPPQITGFSPKSGSPGTMVMIIGAGLTSAEYVFFNDVKVSPTTISATNITVKVPKATSGPIKVSFKNTSNPISVGDFSVITTSKPSITSISPTSGKAGDPVTLFGENLSQMTHVKFGDISAKISTVSNTQISVAVPANASSGYPEAYCDVTSAVDFVISTPSPQSDIDQFGLKMINQTSPNGREWFSKWHMGSERSYLPGSTDVLDPEFHMTNGEGQYVIYGENGERSGQFQVMGKAPRVYVRSTGSNAIPPSGPYTPADQPLWNNVEITFYVNSSSSSPLSYAGVEAVAKTNHMPDDWAETTQGYGGRMLFDGRVDFEKEVDCVLNQNVRSSSVNPWPSQGKMPLNTWIGYKLVARNVMDNSSSDWKLSKKVKLELYREMSAGSSINPTSPSNGGNWELLTTKIDDGSWSTGLGSYPPPTPSIVPQYNPDKAAPLTWPNWSIYLRTDELQGPQYYKWMSVREVAPIGGSEPPTPTTPVVSSYSPKSGPFDTLITVLGSNLAITNVLFGGMNIPFTASDNKAVFKAPNLTDGSYDIQIVSGSVILVGKFIISKQTDPQPPTPTPTPTAFVEPQIDTNIKKGPYMIYPGGNMMTILWQLKSNISTVFKWGVTNACEAGNATVLPYNTSTFQCKYDLSQLKPSTKYFYSLTVNGKTITNTFVSAPPNEDKTLDFLIFGDIQDSGSTFNTSCGTMLKYLSNHPEVQGISFQLGDSVGGKGTSESDWDSIVFGNSGQYANVTKFLAAMPMNTVRGNHNDIAYYSKYFPSPNSNKTFYGFDYGQIHFIAIDTETTYKSGTEQYKFIESELKNNNEMWKIPVFHRPGWSSGDNESQKDVQTELHPLFKQYGVKVVYMAHNHHFSQIIVDGINYLTIGPIGASTKPIAQNQSMIVKSYVIRHFNHISIAGNVLTHKIIDYSSGAVVDSFSI